MNDSASASNNSTPYPSACGYRVRRRPTLLALVVLLATHCVLSAQAPPPPAALDRPNSPEPPSWVSVALAEKEGVTAEGAKILFAPLTRSIMGRLFDSSPVHGCYELGPAIYERVGLPTPPRTLEEAAQQKPVIFLGKVLQLTPGFNIGTAGFLIRAEAEPDSRGVPPGTEAFFFVPIGNFTYHGKRICKTDPRYAGLPAVDDEVLIFADLLSSLRMLHAPREQPHDLALPHLQAAPITYIPVFPDDLVILPAGADATVQYPLSWRQQDNAADRLPRTPAEVLALLPTLPPAEKGGR